jgi:REP element-mobilizing transposase RayT
MRCIFGRVLAESVALSPLGLLVRNTWQELPKHFPYVELDELIIMPNHLHAVLTNRTDAARGSRENIEQFARPVSGSLPTIIRSFKSAVTKRARERSLWGEGPLWQRSYYEHIIRTSESLKEIRWYIQQNPNRWRDRPRSNRPTGSSSPP